jgi:transketolase
VLESTSEPVYGTALHGAYVLTEPEDAVATLIGTGSEVHLCVAAAASLADEGIAVRVVSMPSWEWFDRSDFEYQAAVLREDLPAVSVEAGATIGWERYADVAVGIDEFGTSAPGDVAFEYFGFTPAAVVAAVKEVLGA